MISHASGSFRRQLQTLQKDVQKRARSAFRLFKRNPHHASLKFKRLSGLTDYWSARIGPHYRAVAVREGSTLIWFWIGSHADFDRDFR